MLHVQTIDGSKCLRFSTSPAIGIPACAQNAILKKQSVLIVAITIMSMLMSVLLSLALSVSGVSVLTHNLHETL